MANILRSLTTGTGNIPMAFKATNVADAVVKGYGSKALSKIVQNLAGPLIPSFMFTLPVVNINISTLDIIRYFAHTGWQVRPDLPALIATLLPLLFPNPTGPSNALIVRTTPSINPLGGFGG